MERVAELADDDRRIRSAEVAPLQQSQGAFGRQCCPDLRLFRGRGEWISHVRAD
jgi:hypothetical protein